MGVKKKRENTIMYFIKIKRGIEFARLIVRYLGDKNDKLIPSWTLMFINTSGSF